MADGNDNGGTKLYMDGEWDLMILSGFGRQYDQVYSLFYVIDHRSDLSGDRAVKAFRKFPWVGGWSVVDFYEDLRLSVPHNRRPRIVSLKYESPGHIELATTPAVAAAVGKTVKHVSQSLTHANAVYNRIYNEAKRRKLLSRDVKHRELALAEGQMRFAEAGFRELANVMVIEERQRAAIEQLTANSLVRLKILLSAYRRIRDLAEHQASGRLDF